MSDNETTEISGVDFTPETLDGHTIEELSDYLDAGRTPVNPEIESSPGCRIALESLERLRALTPELFDADIAAEPEPEPSWLQAVLSNIARDARPGRDIPIISDDPAFYPSITEGAVRGLVRAAEHEVPGALVGRCIFDADVSQPGEPIRLSVDVSVPYGDPIPGLADSLREEIWQRLTRHTSLNLVGVDIVVHDVQLAEDAAKNHAGSVVQL